MIYAPVLKIIEHQKSMFCISLSGKISIFAHDCHFCFMVKAKIIKRADTACKYQP